MLYNTTTLHMSSQNGIAEQLNQTLLDHAHAMLFDSGLPKFLWTYVVAYACYLRNRLLTHALDGKTPYEMFFNSKPNIGMIHTFGLDIWVLDQGQIGKLDPHLNKFKFIGLMDNTCTYHYYKPDSGNIAKSRNVIFLCSTPEYNISLMYRQTSPQKTGWSSCPIIHSMIQWKISIHQLTMTHIMKDSWVSGPEDN